MSPSSTGREWTRLYLIIYLIYIGVGLAWRFLLWPVQGDATFYVHAARSVLDGTFDMYSLRGFPEAAPPLGGGYSYSPLTAIIMAPFVGLADLLRWGHEDVLRSIGIPLLFIDVLAMHQLRKLVRAWRPNAEERFLFLGILVTLFLTGLWVVSASRGHHEGLVLLFLFLALRMTPGNKLLGGAYAGLALAAKQPALLELIPVGMVLLAGGSASLVGSRAEAKGDDRWRAAVRDAYIWCGVALLVFGALVLPALVSNPNDTFYALVTVETRRTFFGAGLPAQLDAWMRSALDAGTYTPAREALISHSNTVLIGVVVLVSALAVWRARSRGRAMTLTDSRLMALVAFAAVAQIVLGKWTSAHYYPFSLALVFLWDAVRTAPASLDARPGWGVLDTFPWIGLGAAVAFRSITAIEVGRLKDGLILLLFVAVAFATLLSLRRETGLAARDERSAREQAVQSGHVDTPADAE